MARRARIGSRYNLYHVVLKGINRQIIFEERQDYLSFLRVLEEYIEEGRFRLHAYCLMDNHVHMLIEPIMESLGNIMRRIEVKYARWYNSKYDREGYLFQNRYMCEPIEDAGYLINVFRYIHQNPTKAGLEKEVGEYPWSSFGCYAGIGGIACTEMFLGHFGKVNNCISFLKQVQDEKDEFLDCRSTSRMLDEEAIERWKQVSGLENPQALQKMDIHTRDRELYRMVKNKIPIRQISRITGISRTSISRIVERMKDEEIGAL